MTIAEKIAANEADMLRFLEQAPVVIPENSEIAGFALFDPESCTPPELPRDMHLGDNLHFSMGTSFLHYGFSGVAERARANTGKGKTALQNRNLQAIAAVYTGVCAFVQRHADKAMEMSAACGEAERLRLKRMAKTLENVAKRAPHTLEEAVQTFYFAWKLRGVLNTSTMGRLDQYLYPFYRGDIKAGRITNEDAFRLVCQLWERVNESGSGDTLMNVMLGGQTTDGTDLTNDLSVLMLRASIKVAKAEPHLNYRYHRGMREDFLDLAAKLQYMGLGQATMYNDEVLIPALMKAGVSKEDAYNYTNDGCTEIIIDQKCTIFFDKFDTVKCMELALYNGNPPELPGEAMVGYWNRYAPAGEWQTTLALGYQSGDCSKAESFDEVYACCKRQLEYQILRTAQNLTDNYDRIRRETVAPAFLNGSFEETLTSGEDCHRGGLPETCVTLFSGSIPSVADSLAALKTVVFNRKSYTMQQVLDAMSVNFEGYEAMRCELQHAPKFGNDEPLPDTLAAELATLFFDTVHEAGVRSGYRIWPALLGYLFVQEAFFTGATPDGRRWKEPLAEHYSPTPGKACKGPTAILASVAKAELSRAIGTAPTHISLSRSVMPPAEEGEGLIKQLFLAAAELGLLCLNLAIYNVALMREAQLHPEEHEDIIVRVWGYSARFIDLSEEMQEHVIARVSKQC